MTATTARITVNGIEMFTRTIGDGPDVTVLHGGPGAHHDYLLPQFDDLARGRRLRYYDQRGGGQSPVDRDTDVSWPAHVADLDALIIAWDLSPATLLGYSWGGLLAVLYALEHPDRVGRLALVSAAPLFAEGRKEFEANFAERSKADTIVREREQLQNSGLRDRDPDAYRQRMFELSVAGYFHDMDNVKSLTPFRVTGRTQQAVWESLGDYDLRDRVAELDIPTRVFHGFHDPIPVRLAEETSGLLGAELVVFENSGHCPYVEEREEFTSALDQWLPSGT